MAASPEEMKFIVAKALTDSNFRRRLLADPVGAASAVNVTIDGEQEAVLAEVGQRIEGIDTNALRNANITIKRRVDFGRIGVPGAASSHGSVSW